MNNGSVRIDLQFYGRYRCWRSILLVSPFLTSIRFTLYSADSINDAMSVSSFLTSIRFTLFSADSIHDAMSVSSIMIQLLFFIIFIKEDSLERKEYIYFHPNFTKHLTLKFKTKIVAICALGHYLITFNRGIRKHAHRSETLLDQYCDFNSWKTC